MDIHGKSNGDVHIRLGSNLEWNLIILVSSIIFTCKKHEDLAVIVAVQVPGAVLFVAKQRVYLYVTSESYKLQSLMLSDFEDM